jgi:hypothetical protein
MDFNNKKFTINRKKQNSLLIKESLAIRPKIRLEAILSRTKLISQRKKRTWEAMRKG